MNDPILDVVHETAKGLYECGTIDIQSMRKFDELCLPKIKQYNPKEIKEIRIKNKVSQTIFAKLLNTSISTIQKWEQGNKKPNNISLKLLNIVDKKGLEILR